MENSECKVAHFYVGGEFLTNFFRELWIEDKCQQAYKAVEESLIGAELTHDIISNLLTGKSKLVGVNKLTLEKDNVKSLCGISLNTFDRYDRLLDKYVKTIYSIKAFSKDTYDDTDTINNSRRLSKLSKELNLIESDIKFLHDKFDKRFTFDDQTLFSRLKEYEDSMRPKAMVITNSYNVDDESLDRHLKTAIAVSKMDTITPVDIYNYDAMWISTKGIVYGMNGEISNMLHIAMADLIAPTISTYNPKKHSSSSYTFFRIYRIYEGY